MLSLGTREVVRMGIWRNVEVGRLKLVLMPPSFLIPFTTAFLLHFCVRRMDRWTRATLAYLFLSCYSFGDKDLLSELARLDLLWRCDLWERRSGVKSRRIRKPERELFCSGDIHFHARCADKIISWFK